MEKLSFERRRSKVKNCPCGKSNKDGKFAPFEGYEDKGFCFSCDRPFPIVEEKTEEEEKGGQRPFSTPRPRKESFIESQYLKASLKAYEQNHFVQFLIRSFGSEKAMQAVKAYKVGTSKRWQGATIFWQIDHEDKIRSGKIMVYDSSTGKRDKAKNSWVHRVLKLEEFDLNQCLFGSHLITSDHSKSIGIVESEKTAIIASILMPELIWLASGGKAGLKASKVKFLANRDIILFPDLSKPADKDNCYQLWRDTAKEFRKSIPAINIKVSDYLETRATDEEKSEGLDIADYFLKWEWENEENEASHKPLFSGDKIPNEGNEENDHSEKPFFSGQNEIERIRRIERLKKEIGEAESAIIKLSRKIGLVRNQIRNHFISEEAIRANKEALRSAH